MIEISKLKKYALDLNFTMDDSEYETLEQDFDVFLRQMDLLGEIDNLEILEPMTHPFLVPCAALREDEVEEELRKVDAFKNSKNKINDCICVPTVVSE